MEYYGQHAIAMLLLAAVGFALAYKAPPVLRVLIALGATLIVAGPNLRDKFNFSAEGFLFEFAAALPSLLLVGLLAFLLRAKKTSTSK